MDIKEIFGRMQNGEVAAHSELGTRDESKQTKGFAQRIMKMKTTVGIKAHVLMMKDCVLPFNPFTGEEDNMYNAKTPFRPILLVSQVLEGIKPQVAANPALREKWDAILGSEKIDWDSPVTHNDYLVLKHCGFIKPRIMSYATVALNFGGINGFSEFRQKYTVDPTQLNAGNTYEPVTAPIWHKGAVFFNTMLKREVDQTVSALERNGANKEQIAAQKRAIYAKSPIGFVSPTNLVPFLFFPIDSKPVEMKPDRPTDFEKCIRYYSYTDKWATALESTLNDDSYDENMDFYDFTLTTPSESQTKSNGQVYTDQDSMELYTAMTIATTDARKSVWSGSTLVDKKDNYQNSELYAPVWEAARAYFLYSQAESAKPDGDSFERLMALSNRFRPIDTVLSNLLPACHQVFLKDFAKSEFFHEEDKKANAEFFSAMHPDNALALADADDDELEAAAAAQAVNIGNLIADATGGENAELEALNFEEVPVAED